MARSYDNTSLAIAIALVLAFAPGLAIAADYRESVVPQGFVGPGPSGMTVKVRQVFDANPGVRPVVVQVTSSVGPSAVDRLIEMKLIAVSQWREGSWSTNISLELPAGQLSVTKTFWLPLPRGTLDLGWKAWVDGYEAPDLERRNSASGNSRFNQATVLLIDSRAPAPMSRPTNPTFTAGPRPKWTPAVPAPPFMLTQYSEDQHPLILANFAKMSPVFDYLPPAEIGESWVDYDRYDVVSMSNDDYEMLREKEPKRWQAIRRWATSGGTLYIYPPKPIDVGGDPDERRRRRREFFLPADLEASSPLVLEVPADFMPSRRPDARLLSFGMGRILSVQQESVDIAAVAIADPAFAPHHWAPRHYVDPQRGMSQSQTNFLIEGIGKPPITLFFLLLTLFVVAVGPVAYIVLSRLGRIPLLLVIVPAVSGTITLGLLLVALFGDGLGTRTRVRSVTFLDSNKEFASWSRQTYFCGLAPSSGLIYPRDAAVYPIDISAGPQTPDREIVLDDTTLRLARGYLASREFAQLLVGHTGATERGLRIVQKDAQPPEVENRLGVAIQHLRVVDEGGNIWEKTSIPAGEVRGMRRVIDAEAAVLANDWIMRLNIGYSAPNGAIVPAANGIVEMATLRELRSRRPRSFAAITAGSVEVPMGIAGASEEGSYHFVFGNW